MGPATGSCQSVMQIEGPFSWDQLVFQAKDDDGYDPFNEEELHDAWSKMAASEKACSASNGQSVAMTPLSRPSSTGPLARLEEVWDSALDTPLAPVNHDSAPNVDSPLARRVDTTKPLAPSRLQECITDVFASSPGRDLFSKHESDNEDDTTGQGCFGGFTGIIADSLLEGVNTPTQLRNSPLVEDEENVLFDDMLGGIEAGDLDFGLTQGVLGKHAPTVHEPSVIPPTSEALEANGFMTDADDLRTTYPTTSDFDLPRPGVLFKDVELHVCTPVTPCRDGGVGPDTLVAGTSSYVDTPDYAKENLKTEQNIPISVGFASAGGKKWGAPSAASLRKARGLFQEIDKEIAMEQKKKRDPVVEKVVEENPMPLESNNPAPQVPISVGFSLASGKKDSAPSERALLKARVMFDNIERELQVESVKEHSTENQAPAPRVSFSVGFSSASGKNKVVPSESALKKARVMFDNIEQELDEEEATTTKPAILDLKRLSRNQTYLDSKPVKAVPTFSNLKTVATKTLGNSRRSSASIGLPSIRSSISPSGARRVAPMIPKDVDKVKPDPLKYFDLTIPENRVQLKGLSLHRQLSYEETNCEIDRHRVFTMFMSKGPNPNCVDKRWVWNHIDLILWKVASTISQFRDRSFYGDTSLDKIIVEQLLYRYEREINMTQMSVLKKISEGNDSPVGLFVFLIKDIDRERNELLLSDGWYSLWAVADKEIASLIDTKKLRTGMKIEVTNIGLVKKDETAILDAEESGFKLIVAYNSIRPCRWHMKLGRKRAFTFRRPLKYARRDGGVISCIEAVVTKRYPDVTNVHWEDDDKHAERSKHEWEKMINSNFDDGQNRPDKISKTVRLQIVDSFCGTKASVKLLKVSEELAEKLVEGRVIRLLECKPLHDHKSMLELRVFKTQQQCFLLGMNPDFIPVRTDVTKLCDLISGHEYDVALRIVRYIPIEHHLWGINSDGVLISIELGRFAPTLPKFAFKELVRFMNLEYKAEDKKLGIEVFCLSMVSDWDRKGGQALEIDLANSVFEEASIYIEKIVTGRFSSA